MPAPTGTAPQRRPRQAGRFLLVVAGAVLLAAAVSEARHLQQDISYDKFGRQPMAGAAKGMKAGGQPDPVPGLVNPDIPLSSVNAKTASMEGRYRTERVVAVDREARWPDQVARRPRSTPRPQQSWTAVQNPPAAGAPGA
jgi:hypothetical protein